MTARDHQDVADGPRVSDSQREQVVRDLTRHCGDGRLTLDELEERVAEAYAATTAEDLRRALRELPRSPSPIVQPAGPPVRTKPSDAPVRKKSDLDARRGGQVALTIHAIVYVSVIALLISIWFMSSPFGYFWPMWTAVPWGVLLGVHAAIHKTIWALRD